MRSLLGGLIAAIVLTLTSMNLSAAPVQSLHELTVNSLDGKPVDLSKYKGKVLPGRECRLQVRLYPTIRRLEKLYTEYQDKGLVILGFPANDFGQQEPGTAEEISAFCTSKYNVTFPMFEKVVTKGEDQSPVYQFLTTGFPAPTWNFCKYLVDKNGKVLQEFPSNVKPDDKALVDAIDAALKS